MESWAGPVNKATVELHFSVAGYGGLCLPFSGITEYLRGLVPVYECLIYIAGVRLLMVYSTWLAGGIPEIFNYVAAGKYRIGYETICGWQVGLMRHLTM